MSYQLTPLWPTIRHVRQMGAILILIGAACTAAIAQNTVTVGPTGQYPTPCSAFPNLQDGDTVLIDANNGIPYDENGYSNSIGGCVIAASNLTIVGVNGRPILDATGQWTAKAMWLVDGHDIVIDNFEFRNAISYNSDPNAESMRIEPSNVSVSGGGNGPGGGNVTVQHCYIHNNQTGLLTGTVTSWNGLQWNSANPYITFQYDEFAYNGADNGVGDTHNIYIGYGGNMNFTMQYSWTHDAYQGHTLKLRAPIDNIYYNMSTDGENGDSSDLLDDCNGGSLYVVGNVFYKGVIPSYDTNTVAQHWMIYYDNSEDQNDPMYGPSHQDFHFINNTVVIDPSNGFPSQYISVGCRQDSDYHNCPAPSAGAAPLSVPAVIENNIFIGPAGNVLSNQPEAYAAGNVIQNYSNQVLASMFVDWANYDYHLVPGAAAIQAGIYPPTDNTGAADPKALAQGEFVLPTGGVPRPTPSGNTMDAGAYSYPRVHAPATPQLTYTPSVTAPNTGTITISGLPTPPQGSYNFASFFSENAAAIPTPSSADSQTGTIMTTFTVAPVLQTSTVVPIDIYVDDAHLVANITANPGPPILSSITQDAVYGPMSTVHLEGPAPTGGTVINLQSGNSEYLYVPPTVTVPAGQISAETGSNTARLWGQNPFEINVQITATQGSVVKTVTVPVFAPGIHSEQPEVQTVQGGQSFAWWVCMVGYFPNSGGTFVFTSDNQAAVPNQTLKIPSGNYCQDFQVKTAVTYTQQVANVQVNVNGSLGWVWPITVTPTPATPGAPSNLKAKSNSSTAVNLTWTASAFQAATYDLYRSTDRYFHATQATEIQTGITGTSYVDNSVQPSTTYYYLLKADDMGVQSTKTSNKAWAATTAGIVSNAGDNDVIAIDAGGTGSGIYVADTDFQAGNTDTNAVPVDTSAVVNPAPLEVYQSERWGNFTYTIPGLTPGQTYHVILQFAEIWDTGPMQRQFNVIINGNQVLTNFDIVAAAGAPNKAIAEGFAAVADAQGNIVIQFTVGNSDNPKVNGIEIQNAPETMATFGGVNSLPAGLVLNGKASQLSDRIRLTDGQPNESASAYYPQKVNIAQFTTDFTFLLTQARADGFTFVIQNDSLQAMSTGPDAGHLGYTNIKPSVAVKFDLHNNQGEGNDSTGLYLDGARPTIPATDLSNTGIDLHSADPIHAHITYDGSSLTVTLTDTKTNATTSQVYTVNIPAVVGSPYAYIGFTASTGAWTAVQDILNWNYTSVGAANVDPVAGVHSIVNVNSGMCLTAPAGATAGTQLIQSACTGTTNQTWNIADNGDTTYTLTNQGAGLCLDYAYGSPNDGTPIIVWTCTPTDGNQSYTITKAPQSGDYLLKTSAGNCAEVSNSSTTDGALVDEWSCDSQPNQYWQVK